MLLNKYSAICAFEGDDLRENENSNQLIRYLLKGLIIICLATLAYLVWLLGNNYVTAVSIILILVILVTTILIVEYRKSRRRYSAHSPSPLINRFILMGQEGIYEKEWHVSGDTSFLIGKSTAKSEVDIDLGDTHFSDYVSSEHAVINYVYGHWYIEDIDSVSGVGLKRKGEEHIYRLKPGVSYEMTIGDVIYISKAKLLVV